MKWGSGKDMRQRNKRQMRKTKEQEMREMSYSAKTW